MRVGGLSSFRFHDADIIEGRVDVSAKERERRLQQVHMAMHSGLKEIPRSRLTFQLRHGRGRGRRAFHGQPRLGREPKYSSAFAFFFNEAGVPVYLELPPVGHRSRDELKAKRAALEARRKAPKPRRPWVK